MIDLSTQNKIQELCEPDLIIFDLHNTLIGIECANDNAVIKNELFEGADELLNYLKDSNIEIALLSNVISTTLHNDLENAGIEHFYTDHIFVIDSFCNSCNEILWKQNKILGEKILDQLDFDKENSCVWMIGDGETDIVFAVNSAFLPIGYNNNYAEENGYFNYENHADLLNYFQEYVYIA